MTTLERLEQPLRRSALAVFLRARGESILQSWSARVREELPADNLSEAELRDFIPATLEAIAECLDRGDASLSNNSDLPYFHTLERLAAGFDAPSIVREYGLLRDVVFELFAAEAAQLDNSDARIFNGCIDDAVTAVVRRYTLARERTTQTLEATSRAALGVRDLQTYLERLLVLLRPALPIIDSLLLYLVEDHDRLVVRAAVGPGQNELVGTSVAIGECFAGLAADLRRSVESQDTRKDRRISAPVINTDTIAALYAVPFMVEEKIQGVVLVGSGEPHAFSEEDKIIIREIAARAAGLMRLARAMSALHRSDETLRLVVDEVPSLIAFLDHDERYVFQNREYERWYGIRREEFIGKRIVELVGEENYREVKQYIERALAGETVAYESPYAFRTGKRGFIQAAYVPQFDGDGRVIGFVALVADITARKEQEQEKERRLEVEEQLIGIVSHDLRNPIASIMMSAGALLRRGDFDDRANIALERILSSAGRASRLIRDLLDFTQARLGGGIPIQREAVNLHEEVQYIVEDMQGPGDGPRIQLTHEGDGDCVLDVDRVSQVVTNLIGNAKQHGKQDGKILVTTRGTRDAIIISVHNEGAPIPADLLPQLFTPLSRGGAPNANSGRSVGLGLYIVASIVAAHGGTTSVTSTEAAGTTFTVTLPRGIGH